MVVMGEVVDYFKPNGEMKLSDFLKSNVNHQWSADGVNFETPLYNNDATLFGGSAGSWPKNNVDGDDRAYLSFWGRETGSHSGCCHYSAGDYQYWSRSFKLYIKNLVTTQIEQAIEQATAKISTMTNIANKAIITAGNF